MPSFAQGQKQHQQSPSPMLARSTAAASQRDRRSQLGRQLLGAAGNQAVQRMLQSQADQPAAGAIAAASPRVGNGPQTLPARAPGLIPVQAKLAVSQPGDVYEQEADRIAGQVMRTPEPAAGRGGAPPAGGDEQPDRETVHPQTRGAGSSGPAQADAPASVHDVLRSPGQPLDAATRSFMEARLAWDFRQVRIHTGAEAAQSSQAVNARAYTVGQNVVFGAEEFRPNTAEGRSLLAHELVHVVQQTAPSGGERPAGGRPVQASPAGRSGVAKVAPGIILRQPTPNVTALRNRQQALDYLTSYSSMIDPAIYSVPASLKQMLEWIGNEGLPMRLTITVVQQLNPTLDRWRTLEGWSRVALREVASFPARSAEWEGISRQAWRTEDPAVVDAAWRAGQALPHLAGARWTQFQQFLQTTGRRSEDSALLWHRGFSSLNPGLARALDRLPIEVKKALDNSAGTPRVGDAIVTVLGYPGTAADGAAIPRWIEKLRWQAEGAIQNLGSRAEGLSKVQFTAGSLGAADQTAAAIALRDNFRTMSGIMRRPEGFILERARLAALLPQIRQQLGGFRSPLLAAGRALPVGLGGLLYGLQAWSKEPVLVYFPGDFDWIPPFVEKTSPWASEQEPEVLLTATRSLDGIDMWSGLLAETVAEEETLDEEVPTLPRGWWDIGAHLLWLFRNKKTIIDRLIDKVPLLRELRGQAGALWNRAAKLFERFKERIFKEGRILAPLWEFFLGVLGLETPQEFVADVSQHGGSLLGKILRHPFRFLGNLARAIGRGFSQFGKRIGEHLLNALLDWLLGEFGLQPPVTFGRVLKALMDSIGFSLDAVYEHIAEYLNANGRRTNAAEVRQRIEKVIDLIEKATKGFGTALRWLKLLVTGRFAEFWEEIKNHLADLWRWIVERARHFVVDQLKEKLLPWLLELIDPTGIMAAFKAIKTLYQAIKTVLEYAERIFAMVREVFRAVRNIANGQIDDAAALVESALVRGTAVAIAFFARVLELGSIVKVFKEGLGQIRKVVDAALKALVRAAGEVWKWLLAKAEEIKNWWRARRKFADPESGTRELYFEGEGKDAILYVSAAESRGRVSAQATPKETLGAYVDDLLKKATTARERGIIGAVKDLAKQIDEIKDKSGGSFSAEQGETIFALFNEIVLRLSELGGSFVPPATEVRWDKQPIYGEAHGGRMVASILSIDPGGLIGSKPVAGATKLWDAVRRHKTPGGATFYIRGHLLNHHLHGPGTWENMAPIAGSTNTKMEREQDGTPKNGGVEDKVKHAILDQNKVVRYEVKMVYGKHAKEPPTEEEKKLPSQIEMKAVQLELRGGKWVEPATPVVIAEKVLPNEVREK